MGEQLQAELKRRAAESDYGWEPVLFAEECGVDDEWDSWLEMPAAQKEPVAMTRLGSVFWVYERKTAAASVLVRGGPSGNSATNRRASSCSHSCASAKPSARRFDVREKKTRRASSHQI